LQVTIAKLSVEQKLGTRHESHYAALYNSCHHQFATHFFDKACSQNDRFCSLANMGMVMMLAKNDVVSTYSSIISSFTPSSMSLCKTAHSSGSLLRKNTICSGKKGIAE